MTKPHYLKNRLCKSCGLVLQGELSPSASNTPGAVHSNTHNFLPTEAAPPSDPPWSLYFSHGPGSRRKKGREADLPSQLLFKYTDTNTGGTVKKSTTEFTSSQNHSLSLAAINWGEEKRGKMRSLMPAFKRHSAKSYVLVSCGGLE